MSVITRLIGAGLVGLFVAGSAVAGESRFVEQNVDRYGGDYRVVVMGTGETYQACQALCAGDAQCKAWTYVRAGIEQATPSCRLKVTVPFAERSPCCVSGVEVGANVTPVGQRR